LAPRNKYHFGLRLAAEHTPAGTDGLKTQLDESAKQINRVALWLYGHFSLAAFLAG
jgi:hypothetical protein